MTFHTYTCPNCRGTGLIERPASPMTAGDNRDQRAFLIWAGLWLNAARVASKPGAVLCSFIDWRQLPTLTDAVQVGGWVWRNLATW